MITLLLNLKPSDSAKDSASSEVGFGTTASALDSASSDASKSYNFPRPDPTLPEDPSPSRAKRVEKVIEVV